MVYHHTHYHGRSPKHYTNAPTLQNDKGDNQKTSGPRRNKVFHPTTMTIRSTLTTQGAGCQEWVVVCWRGTNEFRHSSAYTDSQSPTRVPMEERALSNRIEYLRVNRIGSPQINDACLQIFIAISFYYQMEAKTLQNAPLSSSLASID
jgi:hypothetical protein